MFIGFNKMSEDIAEYVLTRFYGIGKVNEEITAPIHEGLRFHRDESPYDSVFFYQNSITPNEEAGIQQSLETNFIDNNEENDPKILTTRSWRAIEDDEDINDEGNDSKDEDLILDEQKIGEINEIDKTRSSLSVKSTLPAVLDSHDDSPLRSRPSIVTLDDAPQDTLSDVSSRSTKKRGVKKSLISSEPKINLPPIIRPPPIPSSSSSILSSKPPVYNGLFCDMSNASIETLSADLFDKFYDIKMLYLENNNLKELPAEIFTKLKFLQWLDVRNNQLTTLPSTIKNHKCLETILLQENQIERLPLELCLIQSLKSIHLANNPLIFPSIDVVSLGFKAIMKCLREEWNKEHPDDIQNPPEEIKSIMTVLCNKQSKRGSKRQKLIESLKKNKNSDKISVREKSKNYRPSNRCRDNGDNEMQEIKFMNMCKLRENLIKQNKILQKMKDKNVLRNWRQDRRSLGKSMKKAMERTKIIFDVDNFNDQSNNFNRNYFTTDINKKMAEIIESMRILNIEKNKEILDPRVEFNRLEIGVKKIKSLKKEIEELKKQNDMSLVPYEGDKSLKCSDYKSPPSIIM